MIKLEHIEVTFGSFKALKDINIDIHEGEFFTFLGLSGCGKTTTLRTITGFISPSAGTVSVRGKDITHTPIEKRNIGMVFQNYAIFPHMTVRDNVAFGLKNRKESKETIQKETNEFMKLMHISEYADRMPDRLSGGQQQRVALAPRPGDQAGCAADGRAPCPTWTPSCAWRCAPSSRRSSTRWASPMCTSPTTRKKPWPFRTASRS